MGARSAPDFFRIKISPPWTPPERERSGRPQEYIYNLHIKTIFKIKKYCLMIRGRAKYLLLHKSMGILYIVLLYSFRENLTCSSSRINNIYSRAHILSYL